MDGAGAEELPLVGTTQDSSERLCRRHWIEEGANTFATRYFRLLPKHLRLFLASKLVGLTKEMLPILERSGSWAVRPSAAISGTSCADFLSRGAKEYWCSRAAAICQPPWIFRTPHAPWAVRASDSGCAFRPANACARRKAPGWRRAGGCSRVPIE